MQRTRKLVGAVIAVVLLATAAPVAQADPHDSERSAHPVRIIAYLLHPIGVVLDYALLRPAHWLGHQEPFRTLFGHKHDE